MIKPPSRFREHEDVLFYFFGNWYEGTITRVAYNVFKENGYYNYAILCTEGRKRIIDESDIIYPFAIIDGYIDNLKSL